MSKAYQLEEEGKAHDQGVGRQEVLLATDHEGAHHKVLPCGRCLGHLHGRHVMQHGLWNLTLP